MRAVGTLLFLVLLGVTQGSAQLVMSNCELMHLPSVDCKSSLHLESVADRVTGIGASNLLGVSSDASSPKTFYRGTSLLSPKPQTEKFHWHRALAESFTFLIIEQAYVIHNDFSWVVSESGVPFNHFWRDYAQSLSSWTHSGWNDGDPNWYGYVGHPIQGALTGFIQIQNDPRSEKLEFSKSKAYWWSRFKAALWNAAYSTQWNLGPLSEVTVEKYGTKDRPPWNHNGSYPCTHHCFTGVGQIDIVMTPLGGTGWLIGEDFLDKELVRRVEGATQNRFLIDAVRCALNPVRGGANILHGERPWYRATRDFKTVSFKTVSLKTDARQSLSTIELPKATPDHGGIFLGFSHIGGSRCQTPVTNHSTPCDSFSNTISDLSGWNTSIERKYLRYFGAVADFSHQFGNISENDFLFGLRGGVSVAHFRPFAEVLLGAVQTQGNRAAESTSNISFAEALGAGIDLRLGHLLGWRFQVDELHTELASVQQDKLRLSSGLLARF